MASKRGNRGGRGSFVANVLRRPQTISTNNALLWGVAWLILGTIACWHFWFLPISSFGYVATGYTPLVWQLAFNLIVGFVSVVLFFSFGVMSNRRVGFVDIFGRMLFARWPITLLILLGLIDGSLFSELMRNPGAAYDINPMYTLLMALGAVVILLWSLYWGYLAYCRATQRKGIVTLVVYVVAVVLSYLLSKVTMSAVYKNIGEVASLFN